LVDWAYLAFLAGFQEVTALPYYEERLA